MQDFDPAVQEAIHRVQSVEETRALIDAARALGFRSVNLDLVYGLPLQTVSGFQRTLEIVHEMQPDRLACYGYAHVPWLKKHQKVIREQDLPRGEDKLELYSAAHSFFVENGYEPIGMDHFARADDDLAVAARRGELHRNFMGSDVVVDTPVDDPPAEDPAEEAGVAMPANDYCAQVEQWDDGWTAFEQAVLEVVNQRRAEAADCGSSGLFDPASPLTFSGALTCAARNHALDMNIREFFDHRNPDGDGPGVRIDQAGYGGSGWGENIAAGYASPKSVVDGWMSSPGHCGNIMNASFTEIGVGYSEGNYWVQVFGSPR